MKNNAIGIVIMCFIVTGLCAFVGFLAWAPNTQADFEGMGFFGVLMPIMAVIAAFMFGVGTGLSMDIGTDLETETESSPSISL